MEEVLQPFLAFLQQDVQQLEELKADASAFQDSSIRELFLHAKAHPEQIDDLLRLIANFLDEEADTYKKGLACIIAGTLVENGGDPAVIVGAVVRQLERHLQLLEAYFQQDAALPLADRFEKAPDTVKAQVTSDFVVLATMTMICRDKHARIEMRQNQQLCRLIEELEEQVDNLHYVNVVLGSADDLEVVALHPETSTGIRLRLSMVQNNFHLFTLLQDVFIQQFQSQEPFASMPRNEVAVKAATGVEYPDTENACDSALFGFYSGGALDENGFLTEQGAFSHWLFGEDTPQRIPRVEEKAIVLLGPSLFAQRSWDLSFCVPVHDALTPQAELVEVLSGEQVKAWSKKIIEQWKKAK